MEVRLHGPRKFCEYRLGEFIAAILSNPERASYWAENCGSEAGTGYCSRARRPEAGANSASSGSCAIARGA